MAKARKLLMLSKTAIDLAVLQYYTFKLFKNVVK